MNKFKAKFSGKELEDGIYMSCKVRGDASLAFTVIMEFLIQTAIDNGMSKEEFIKNTKEHFDCTKKKLEREGR